MMLALTSIAVVTLGSLLAVSARSENNVPPIDPEFRKVTCGSHFKLTHKTSSFKLHSHEISYGSGSGQQSVTGFPSKDDPNSLWAIDSGFNEKCLVGEPIRCDATIRLRHLQTGKRLHSHLHASPLSENQEVSAFDGENAGDNWVVKCQDSKDFWLREETIRLMHGETNYFLSSSTKYTYRSPIPGQLEIAAVKSATVDTNWVAEEGIYFANRNEQ